MAELTGKNREEEILAEIGAFIDARIDGMTPTQLQHHTERANQIRKAAAARHAQRESGKAREKAPASAAVRRA